jgi:thiol:disulfide interchange protein
MDIVEIAEELEALHRTGTRVPGFRRKVLVDIDRLSQVSDELREAVPASMREADEVLKQKESIINQAYLESQRIKGAADQEASAKTTAAQQAHDSKVEESEVYKTALEKVQELEDQAMVKAQEIIQDAQKKAYRIMNETDSVAGTLRDGADRYAREVLFNLEEQIAASLGQVRAGIDRLGEDSTDEVEIEVEPDREPVGNHVPA